MLLQKPSWTKTLLRHLKVHRILCIDTKVIIACQNLCLKLVYKGNCEQNKNINDFLNASVYSRGTRTPFTVPS